MLHNSGAYGPNETPHNASTPVNMSQVAAPINIGRSLQNMGDIAQQPLRGPSGHYNLPHYSAYNLPNLDMRSNLDAFTKDFHHQYMTQNPTSVHNTRWPNGLTPLNLNAQSTYVPNMHNFHAYDKEQSNSTHIPINLKDNKSSDEKTALNLVESSSKTSDNQNYYYNTNADIFSSYNQNYQQNVSGEKPILDVSKRRSLENTVKLIETILINTTKETQNNGNDTSDIFQKTNTFEKTSDKPSSNNAEFFEKMAKTLNAIKECTETPCDRNAKENKTDELENRNTNITENVTESCNKETDIEINIEPMQHSETTNDSNDNKSVSNNPVAQPEDVTVEPKIPKLKIKVEIDLIEPGTEYGSEEYQLEFCRDLNGMAKEDVELTEDKIIISENSIGVAQYAIESGSSANNYYECVHCHLLFNHPKRFLIHAKWHTFGLTNERRLKLAREREYQRKQRREAKIVDQLHKALEEDCTTYPCKDCLKIFCSKGSLKNHRTRLHSGRIRECGICGAVAMGWAGLRAHAATHTEPYKCNICDKVFRHKHSLSRHAETHMDDEEKTLRCELCGKLFATPSRYKEHQRVHIREERGAVYQCSYCAKSFKQAYSLTIHERTHRNEKPYVCDICHSSYGTNSSLKRHMKVSHNRSKPFECAECRRCFTTSKALTGHIVRVHTDPSDPKKRKKKSKKPKDPMKQQPKGAKSKKDKKETEDIAEETTKVEDEQTDT